MNELHEILALVQSGETEPDLAFIEITDMIRGLVNEAHDRGFAKARGVFAPGFDLGAEIRDMCARTRPVAAIKQIRRWTGYSLKKSKEIYDQQG